MNKGIHQKKMWAVFGPTGKILFWTISKTELGAKESSSDIIPSCYLANGYTTNKILVDIKIIT